LSTATAGPSRAERGIRALLVAGYLAFIAGGFLSPWQPRVFWTVLLPLVPLAIVVMGFPLWRRICPLAWFGEIGRNLKRSSQRKVPAWLEGWFFMATFAGMLVMLVLRLVATNGDGVWLALLLVGLALAALVSNRVWTGKSWCNFFCPVGLIERIYTEPASLREQASNSQCARCTACKRSCPDIDQENGYWRDLTSGGRRIASYAWPGLVLAFYVYFWLRHGDWEAYFDGRWTRLPADGSLAFGPGFFFAPGVPALVAATLTLVVFSAASYGAFAAVEGLLAGRVQDAERRRHLVLALAAFAAFNLFYLWAGAPTLRELPGGIRGVAFLAPLVGTLFLLRRWRRRREHFIRDKGAAKLLRNWPFDEPPPADREEVYGFIKAGEHAREQSLAAYANTVREMIADGLVRGGELRLLGEIRKQLGISEREHDRIIARLSEEERELFTLEGEGRVEERAQLDGYQAALAEVLLRHPSEEEIRELREAFGVSEEAHAKLLERMRGESGALYARAKGLLTRASQARLQISQLLAEDRSSRTFLAHLLHRGQQESLGRVVDFLEVAGEGEKVRPLRDRLFAARDDVRRTAVEQLAAACPEQADIVKRLGPLLTDPIPQPAKVVRGSMMAELLGQLAAAPDPFVRAAVIWAAGEMGGKVAGAMIPGGLTDRHELVRETAVAVAHRALAAAEAQAGGAAAGEGDGAAPEREGRRDALGALRAAVAGQDEASYASLATIERMQFLRRVPLFSDLDPEDLYDLARLTREEEVVPPAAICEEGDAVADDLFVLVNGEAGVTVAVDAAEGGGEKRLGVMKPGEVIGELAVLDGCPRSATVRPLDEPVTVLRIPGELFRSRLLQRARVSGPLLTTMAQRIRRLSQEAAKKREHEE